MAGVRMTAMQATAFRRGARARLLPDVLHVLMACLAAFALIYGLVALFGLTDPLRGFYGLTPDRPTPYPAWDLWLNNVRVTVPVFVAAAAVDWARGGSRVVDVAVGLWVALQVVLLAGAFAAYGWPVARSHGSHAFLEVSAGAVAVAGYLDARRKGRVRPWPLVGCAVLAMVVLWIAAVLESGTA